MQRNKNEPLKREIFAEGIALRREAEGESRVLELSFSSEQPYERWFGTEILSHEAGAIDLTRLKEIGIVLFNHDHDKPIGQILSVELDEAEHRCRAVVRLDTDELAEMVYQKVQSGTLKGVSVGYRVTVWEDVEDGAVSTNGRFAGPCCVAARWEPYEVSIVSVPADASVGVGRSVESNDENKGDAEMEEKKETTPTVNLDEERAAAGMAERQRVMDITSMCRSFGVDAEKFIADGTSVAEASKAIMIQLAEERKAVNITVQADEADKFRAAAVDGLAMRAGVAVAKPAAGAEDFRGKRMLRLAAECIEREKHIDTRNMDDEQLVREALTGTGAFPGILSNVANKSMAQAYQETPTTFQLWTGTGSNSDFKQAVRYRLSEAEELEAVAENGEFKNGKISEASVGTSVATYGKTFSLTRKAIINDDLGALSSLPSLYGAAAKRMINKMVYKILTDNPSIDGNPLFHAKHSNISTGVISVEGIAALKTMMARQKNIAGKAFLNIQPAFLIVPPELEVAATQLISSAVDPTKHNATPNPFANRLSVVADPELTDIDTWYLAAAFGFCPTIEVTYLNGNAAPTMESAVQFDTLGIKYRIYQDVGVNLLDYRGLAKSTNS